MQIRNKHNRDIIEQIPLINGECLIFGLETNQHWLHSVPKGENNDERISITFRRIETFLNNQQRVIGQGSPFKSIKEADQGQYENYHVQKSDTEAYDELISAFSQENKQHVEFNWEKVYGKGFTHCTASIIEKSQNSISKSTNGSGRPTVFIARHGEREDYVWKNRGRFFCIVKFIYL